MATITRKKTGSKSSAKAKPVAKSNGSSPRRSSVDRAKQVPVIVKMRQAGETWNAIQEKTGIHGIPARKLIAEHGYDSGGNKLEVTKITGSGAALAKKIAIKRFQGVAWYTLALATGKSEAELKALLSENGHDDAVKRTYIKSAEPKATSTTKRSTKGKGKTEDPFLGVDTDEERAKLLIGRRVRVVYESQLLPDARVLEHTFRCTAFRRTLPATEERDELIQFYAQTGGMRTVRRREIKRIW